MREKGFTLIELLIVVAVIGLVAAIAIPNMVSAVDRGKQKRTMSDLRTAGMAIQAYVVDTDAYPVGSTIADLSTSLAPDYIQTLPRRDAWGNDILYAGTLLGYSIGSPGKDGGGTLSLTGGGGATHDFRDDIIYVNGGFVQWPEGAQE